MSPARARRKFQVRLQLTLARIQRMKWRWLDEVKPITFRPRYVGRYPGTPATAGWQNRPTD